MGRVTVRRPVLRVRDGRAVRRPDTLAAEEPMEIRVAGRPLTVTMRTPGHDFDLAAGFLVSEGVVHAQEHVRGVRYCAGATEDGSNTYNIVDVVLAPGVPLPDTSLERNFYTTSSCGLCGKASLDAVRTTAPWSVAEDPVRVSSDVLFSLPERLRAAQRVFDSTGGLHATGLFSAEGELLCLREDVGRHNAVDKVVGHALQKGLLPLRGTVLMVSGRASFELVQKAVMAGIPVLAAVSAPSSLAADLAEEAGLTLLGFLRGESVNVYTRGERLVLDDGPAALTPPGPPARPSPEAQPPVR
jgi:FdhD protein